MVDGPDALSKEAQRNATLLFFSHLRATFASKRVLKEYKLTSEAFDWILGEVETRFNLVRLSSQLPMLGPSQILNMDRAKCAVNAIKFQDQAAFLLNLDPGPQEQGFLESAVSA